MDENVKWLQEHKFNYCEVKQEWSRDLDIEGNFRTADEPPKYDKRTIQKLTILVSYLEHEENHGWIAKLLVQNGYDLSKKDAPLHASAHNFKAFLCDTPKDAIAMAANDLGDILCACLKQVAKLATKELTLSFVFKEDEE